MANQLMISEALRTALNSVLACPECHGALSADIHFGRLVCLACGGNYLIDDGIPVFFKTGSKDQEDERNLRDRHAAAQAGRDEEALLEIVARHHNIPVMRERAGVFHARLGASEWLVDIGVGYGWHWTQAKAGAKILGIDLSLGNLRLAKRLLRNSDRVALVCADAGALPVRSGVVSGIWSVQTP